MGGVSRTAVWKAMETLRNQGHVIEGIPNRGGYRLLTSTLLYSKERLQSLLPSWELHLFDSIDSTNRYAKSLKSKKALVLACHQSEGGRGGRLSRSFYSPQGGLYLSLLFPAVFPLSDASLITSAAAVAVSEAIEEMCGKYCQIKWVNDLFYQNRKVCGILTEGVLGGVESGRLTAVVVGIGLNLFTKREAFEDSLKTIATSLYDGEDSLPSGFSVDALVARIVGQLEDSLSTYLTAPSSLPTERDPWCLDARFVCTLGGKQSMWRKPLQLMMRLIWWLRIYSLIRRFSQAGGKSASTLKSDFGLLYSH